MYLHWTLDMRRPRLIPDARLAWRFGSVQVATLLALLSAVQAEVLPLVAPLFAPEVWPWVSGGLALAVVVLRLVAQPGLDAQRQAAALQLAQEDKATAVMQADMDRTGETFHRGGLSVITLFNWIGIRFGVNTAWRLLCVGLPLLALLVGAGAGAWGGYTVGRAPLLVDLATLKQTHTESLRLTQQAAAKRLQDAQNRSDTLSTALAETITQTTTLQQEKTHALRLAATGRVCLSERALSVLNGSPGLSVAGLDAVPSTESAAAAADAAAASHSDPAHTPGAPGRVATDEDIGAWSIGAGAQYETCRARLDALIDWHTTTPEAAP
jgi:hypothetical protein